VWGRDTGLVDPESLERGLSGGLVSLADGGLLVADGFEADGVTTIVTLDPSGPNQVQVTIVEDAENVVVLRYDAQGALVWAFADGGDEIDQTAVQIAGLALRAGGAFTVAAFIDDGPAAFGVGTLNETSVPTTGAFGEPERVALATYGPDGMLLPPSR